MNKAAIPSPYERATHEFSRDWSADASDLLSQKFADKLTVDEEIFLEALWGKDCALLKASVGNSQKAFVFELFIAHLDASGVEAGFGLLVDFLDGVLEEFFMRKRGAGFGLDFAPRQFEASTILVRQEFHNFEAERLADELLKNF
jgi:hypothetical protein